VIHSGLNEFTIPETWGRYACARQDIGADRQIRVQPGFPQIKVGQLKSLPIGTIDFGNPPDKVAHDQMVSLVNNMLDLNKKLTQSKIPQAIEVLKRQIDSTDKQIDHLVYNLYDLTDEEIKIVESET